MSLSKYLKSIAKEGAVSETAFYTPLKTHILCGLLNYPTSNVMITPKQSQKKKSDAGKSGIPDLRVYADDKSEWIVGEAKLSDEDIRNEKKRNALWQDKMVERHYIAAETFYVLLVAPKTFYLYDVHYKMQAGIHIEDNELLNVITNKRVEHSDKNFQQLFSLASYESSQTQPQLNLFRKGELAAGYIQIDETTLPKLEEAFTRSIDDLKTFCNEYFNLLKKQFDLFKTEEARLQKKLIDIGGDRRAAKPVRLKLYRLKSKHRLHRQLFEDDYPNFCEAQAYSGTENEKDFQDVFVTNTCHVALSRLIFVRIAEDIGLTEKRISNAGMASWKLMKKDLRLPYQNIVDFTFKQVQHLYNRLFEESAFDWYGEGNGELSKLLERVLFRLNAFSFTNISRDILGTMYQSFRPKIERKRLGEYYTADAVVDFILNETGIATDDALLTKKILDPSCGSFTFGVRAVLPVIDKAKQLSAENKLEAIRSVLHGADINAFSVFLSHLSIFFSTLDLYKEAKEKNPEYEIHGFNLFVQNSLMDISQFNTQDDESHLKEDSGEQLPAQFDYVVGNPPFVRNERTPELDREAMREIFEPIWRKNPDLSLFFIYAMLRNTLKDGGTLGFVLPIGIANADYASPLRKFLFDTESLNQKDRYTITTLVSLEWFAKEVFADADIIPMLLFVKKQKPEPTHRIKIISGLKSLADLKQATTDAAFRKQHTSDIPYEAFKKLSPSGDWCLEVTTIDLPILQKLRSRPTLNKISKTSFAIKVGSGTAAISKLQTEAANDGKRISFGKGQHISAFAVSEADETLDLSKLNLVEDASIWGRLDAFKKQTSADAQLEVSAFAIKPADTFACAVPRLTKAINAMVFSPFKQAFNDSSLVVTPLKYTAHTICAIINSLPSRYFAFLTSRSAILLRRRTTWVARTIDNLPLPELTDDTAAALHRLSEEAHEISASASLTVEDRFLELRQKEAGLKAGLLGVQWEAAEGVSAFEQEELETAVIRNGRLELKSVTFTAPSANVLALLLIALRCEDADEIKIDDVQDILLPKDNHKAIAEDLAQLKTNLITAAQRMADVMNQIDEIVAKGLGIADDLDALRKRCEMFPLSETVMKPRYVWSLDRKRQARRIYDKGDRFKK
jgi:hypothetical protein